MKRNITVKLEEWINGKKRKPLIVYGARQVGKTFIINEFCSNCGKNYKKIDLLNDNKIIDIYNDSELNTTKKRLEQIQLHFNFNINDAVVFFDEVQVCHKLIQDLKYINIEYPNSAVICAGSLLGVSFRKIGEENISMPVGYVDTLYMEPMSFEEFLVATLNERYIPIIEEAYKNNTPLNDTTHRTLMELYYRFLYLGGMPEVIQNYLDNNQSLVEYDKSIIQKITEIYIEDMNKYILSNKERIRIQRIYENIIPQLLKENPKFTFAKIDDIDNRKRDYISALDWLVKSRIVYKCDTLTKVEYPINFFKDTDNYKLYLNDTGIMSFLGNVNVSNITMDGDYQAKGIIAENYVASELVKQGFQLTYYSIKNISNNSMEIDFIIQIEDEVIPIEVKSGKDNQSKSLKSYIESFGPEKAIRISPKNFGLENKIKSVPLYAVFCIKKK